MNAEFKRRWQTAKQLFLEYAEHTTIHGVSYIGEQGRSCCERVLWSVILTVSVLGCGKLIFDAWHINPIIISFTAKPTPIWQIPFPAVTICPGTYARSDRINLTDVAWRLSSGVDIVGNLTERERLLYLSKNVFCPRGYIFEGVKNYTDCNECRDTVRQIRIPVEEIFIECKFRNQIISCASVLDEVVVNHGLCYTFNGFELYRRGSESGKRKAVKFQNWNVDDGFKSSDSSDSYPRRASRAGQNFGLSILVRSDMSEMDFFCSGYPGFKVGTCLLNVTTNFKNCGSLNGAPNAARIPIIFDRLPSHSYGKFSELDCETHNIADNA